MHIIFIFLVCSCAGKFDPSDFSGYKDAPARCEVVLPTLARPAFSTEEEAIAYAKIIVNRDPGGTENEKYQFIAQSRKNVWSITVLKQYITKISGRNRRGELFNIEQADYLVHSIIFFDSCDGKILAITS
jgi:hypothetical protein